MNDAAGFSTLQEFATALLIGALIGVEREKRKAAEVAGSLGGLRTFILFSLLGALAGWLARTLAQPALLVAALAVAAALVLAGYVLAARLRPEALGLTTEAALLVVCLLGATVTLGHRDLAVVLAVVTAAVLAYKQPLHGLVEKLGWDDVFAGLRLLLATFVVLPLLPDRPVDPWQALNPYALWLLVILISSLSLIGYVATRWLGAARGTALTGLTGGLVSSTAVSLAFARRGRDEPGAAPALACGILLAWGVMFARVVVEVLVVNTALLGRVLVPFLAMGTAAAALAWLFYRGSGGEDGAAVGEAVVPLRNPFSLTSAIQFAAFFAVVLLLVKLVQLHLPGQGVYLVAALAGLTDVDAITLSMAEYARANDPGTAVTAIVLAALTNTLVKCAMVAGLSGPALRWRVLAATAVVLAAGAAALMLA
jgi:uncharacterized membrane protein (DUF4010 family)